MSYGSTADIAKLAKAFDEAGAQLKLLASTSDVPHEDVVAKTFEDINGRLDNITKTLQDLNKSKKREKSDTLQWLAM
jgi:hypothetical protein